MNYFINKEENKKHAQIMYEYNKNNLSNEINYSIANTYKYNEYMQFPYRKANSHMETEIVVIKSTTVDAIKNLCDDKNNGKVAALNFASYKHPGGMFLNGSSAQEESLCHSSTLYNVLESFNDSYYENNRKSLNKALYLNRALYSKNILFDLQYNCDIITCAAPNIGPLIHYNSPLSKELQVEIFSTQRSRIEFVLHIAEINEVNTLILGAFGCGVFHNDPDTIARIFKELLCNRFKNSFNKVCFAIPDDRTYNIFKSIINK